MHVSGVEVPLDDSRRRSRDRRVQSGAHDPRVTRVGRLLRMTAMDELPQLWSIFRGDMSFTGPRALRPGEIEALGNGEMELLEDVPGFAARASVLPGPHRHRADLRAARHPAPPQVQIRPPLRAPPVDLARRASHRALVLDHGARILGSTRQEVLDLHPTTGCEPVSSLTGCAVNGETACSMHDVVVVGGGPGGLHAARRLAAGGARRNRHRRARRLGTPVHCTGILARDAFDEFGLSRASSSTSSPPPASSRRKAPTSCTAPEPSRPW